MLNLYGALIKNKIPNGTWAILQKSLKKLDDRQLEMVTFTRLSEPSTAFILSVLFGFIGLDRFYLNQIEKGIDKILLSVIGLAIFIFGILYSSANGLLIFVFLSTVILILNAITIIRDWFDIIEDTKRSNLKKLFEEISDRIIDDKEVDDLMALCSYKL